ncbi:hypothetical protein TRAPUB_7728 [Trametes pubescens]|uniref:Uncharacterized protein n=1 Tax=Trametes pubescens TaxID=154538 RepID=A0A1M2V2J3_TRAPU|nr:hypothetical protein TRAPUB_7728 [Trametes pubescens]
MQSLTEVEHSSLEVEGRDIRTGIAIPPVSPASENGELDRKDEKASFTEIDQVISITSVYSDDTDGALQDLGTDNPFPVDPDALPEEQQFTFRAVFVGCALGAVISASK